MVGEVVFEGLGDHPRQGAQTSQASPATAHSGGSATFLSPSGSDITAQEAGGDSTAMTARQQGGHFTVILDPSRGRCRGGFGAIVTPLTMNVSPEQRAVA